MIKKQRNFIENKFVSRKLEKGGFAFVILFAFYVILCFCDLICFLYALTCFLYAHIFDSYKKQTNTNYANKICDKAGDYSGMRQHSLKFTRAAETLSPTTPIRNIIFKLVK
jgi:hypothetical protein